MTEYKIELCIITPNAIDRMNYKTIRSIKDKGKHGGMNNASEFHWTNET